MAKNSKHALHLSNDSDEMKEAIAALEALMPSGVKFVRKTAHPLKSGDYNFYPNTDTLTEDDVPKTQAARTERILGRDRAQSPTITLACAYGRMRSLDPCH